jgi:hypothetical protein
MMWSKDWKYVISNNNIAYIWYDIPYSFLQQRSKHEQIEQLKLQDKPNIDPVSNAIANKNRQSSGSK